MNHKATSIRPFIGAKDFEVSRRFYRDLGFEERVLANNMSYFNAGGLGFYLQDAYVKDWIDNTMVFLEVENVALYWKELLGLALDTKYKNVRLTPIRVNDWGRECFCMTLQVFSGTLENFTTQFHNTLESIFKNWH